MAGSWNIPSQTLVPDSSAADSSGGGWDGVDVASEKVAATTLSIKKASGFKHLPVIPIEQLLGGNVVPLFARSPDEFQRAKTGTNSLLSRRTLVRFSRDPWTA